MGDRVNRNGRDGVRVDITNTSNLLAELIEMEYPLKALEYSLVKDAGGVGQYRGGMGLRRVLQPVGHACELTGVGELVSHQPWAIFGGKRWKFSRFTKRTADGFEERLANKASDVPLQPVKQSL